MSDVPRFDCFDDGMREGYNERWVRSSDYDALIAERDALAKDAARYRWLRKLRGIPESAGPSIPWATRVTRIHGKPAMTGCYGEELDAAIDAAIAAQRGGA